MVFLLSTRTGLVRLYSRVDMDNGSEPHGLLPLLRCASVGGKLDIYHMVVVSLAGTTLTHSWYDCNESVP